MFHSILLRSFSATQLFQLNYLRSPLSKAPQTYVGVCSCLTKATLSAKEERFLCTDTTHFSRHLVAQELEFE